MSKQGAGRVLVCNPNSNAGMTESLKALLESKWPKADLGFFTAPSGPESINSDEDGHESLLHCVPALLKSNLLSSTDCFVVACYSRHPLVAWLEEYFISQGQPKPVVGIFQASVWESLKILSELSSKGDTFGIVSTGDYWEANLTQKVQTLGSEASAHFGGITTTGLSAKELHHLSRDQVALKMNDATKRLLRQSPVKAICLGCAGMAGLDGIVRDACLHELGSKEAASVRIVDGCVAALAYLESMLQ